MTAPICLDATVIGAALLDDGTGGYVAKQLIARHLDSQLNACVPDVFFTDVANLLVAHAASQGYELRTALEACESITSLMLTTYPARDRLLQPAMSIAYDYGISVSDGLYVALAEELGCKLVTADPRLAASLAEAKPFVKRLSEFRLNGN